MQQQLEMITKIKTDKEASTRSGKYLYSFNAPISKMSGEAQLTEWLQVSILQDPQRNDLKYAKEVYFIGQFTVKEAYHDFPQGLSIFGFFIEPIFGQVYRQRKV